MLYLLCIFDYVLMPSIFPSINVVLGLFFQKKLTELIQELASNRRIQTTRAHIKFASTNENHARTSRLHLVTSLRMKMILIELCCPLNDILKLPIRLQAHKSIHMKLHQQPIQGIQTASVRKGKKEMQTRIR